MKKSIGFLVGILGLIIPILTTSVYTVDESENAAVITLGKLTDIKTAGLHFKLPAPIQRVKKVQVNRTQRLEIGYNPKNNDYISDEAKMITWDFNIVLIDFFIEWRISNIHHYLFNAENPELILKNVAQAAARSVIASKKVDVVLTSEKEIIQMEIKEELIRKLEAYKIGIFIQDVKIQDAEPPTDEVKTAFKDVETAKQKKETLINDALKYKNSELPKAQSEADKLMRKAESYKESRINEAKGDIAKFNYVYEEYAKNKGVTKTRMYLEVIEEVFPNIPVYIESSNGNTQKLLPLGSFMDSKKGGTVNE